MSIDLETDLIAHDLAEIAAAPTGGRHRAASTSPARGRSRGRRARRSVTPGAAILIWILLSVGLLAVWLVAFALVLSAAQEGRAQHLDYDQFRQELSLATAPLGDNVAPGSPVAILDAPSADLDTLVVVEGTSSQAMQDGPGHRRDTVLPGQAGVSLVYGRSVTFGAPFRSLRAMKIGDTITATTAQGQFTYVVSGIRRPGDPLPAALPAGGSRLTLATATGAGWRRAVAPDSTVYVDATLKGQAQPSPGSRPSTVAPSERLLAQDTGSLLLLMLWLELFLAASAILVWTWYRWGRWQTWIVGVPVLVAILWGVSENLMPLLPNVV